VRTLGGFRAWARAWFGRQEGSELDAWLRGRSWLPRAPVLLASAWFLLGWLEDPDRSTIFFGLNLGIHEAGHLLTGGLGMLICAAAGSIFQCLAPIVAAALFIRQRDFFAPAFCLTWLASNLFYVAWYLSDASTMAVPLLSVGGGEAYHDWNTILDTLGMLGAEGFLAGLVRLAGYACAVGAVAWGCWVLWLMARRNRGSRR
jgi:hypothetical protein